MQTDDLSLKVTHGGLWLLTLRLSTRSLGLIRMIILARLLMPADFGIVGMAMMVISTLDSLSQTGFQAALVQNKSCSPPHLDTAWTILAMRGLVLFFIIFGTAPAISGFFNTPDVDLLLKVIAISVVLSGFRNIGLIFFQKEMQFDKQFKYELLGSLIDLVVSIGLAIALRSVWALVWGGLAGNMGRLFLSYYLSRYRPHMALDITRFKELLSYGKWILGTGIVYSILAQADSLTIGKLLGPAELGFYQMAMLIAFLPSSEISGIAAQVTFPAYAIIRDDRTRLRSSYLDVLRLTVLISIPLGALIFIMIPDFTVIFLGEKWQPMISCLQILVFAGMAISIAATTMPVFSAQGKPKVETCITMVNMIILLVLVYPLTKVYGITGTAMAVLAAYTAHTLLSLHMVARLLDCPYSALVKSVLFPSLIATLMAMTLMAFKTWSVGSLGIASFLSFILAGIVTYVLIIYLADRILGYGVMSLFMSKVKMVIKILSSRDSSS